MILLLLIPLLPLTAALVLSFPHKFLRNKAGIISALFTGASLIPIILMSGAKVKTGITWFSTAGFNLTFSLTAGGLEWLSSLIVALTGLTITIFSVKFIEERQQFFFRVMSFFIGSMLTLVLSDSFILTFISWEFVGLSSFLLIGFWFRETDAKEASRKAFLTTRIGDFGFLTALLLILVNYGTTDITSFLHNLHGSHTLSPVLLSFLFLTAALGKSAQLPFTSWLPDAMAGPAPVSALIHSATMVAAGVFLLLKLFPLFEASRISLSYITWIGGITALTAALVASTRYDIKRILAWSTISQLGEMYFVIGLGGAIAAAFHLAVHAVFKAGLFLTAGVIGHKAGTKDIKELGNLRESLPYTAAAFILCGLALSGFPPFAGFWSEDEIMSEALKHGAAYSSFMIILIFLAGVYISRAGASIFARWNGNNNWQLSKPGKSLIYPMLFLAGLAIIAGYILKLNIESLLNFRPSPSIGWGWRSGAIAASISGLVYGTVKVLKSGPVPSFGNLFSYLVEAVNIFIVVPVRIIQFASTVVKLFERILDSAAKGLSELVLSLAKMDERTELAFDRSAQGLSSFILNSADDIDRTEIEEFSKKADEFALSFSAAGKELGKLQSGKIFIYTLILFSWIIITALIAGAIFIF